nr:hypothetical protein [Mesocricetibacter intestinalis]
MNDISIKNRKLTLQTYVDNMWRDMAERYFNTHYELESMEYLPLIFLSKPMQEPYPLIIL